MLAVQLQCSKLLCNHSYFSNGVYRDSLLFGTVLIALTVAAQRDSLLDNTCRYSSLINTPNLNNRCLPIWKELERNKIIRYKSGSCNEAELLLCYCLLLNLMPILLRFTMSLDSASIIAFGPTTNLQPYIHVSMH